MQYKVRDWQAGEQLLTISLSDNKLRELEELVLTHLKDQLPAGTITVTIEADVSVQVAKQPGEPLPFDGQLFQYRSQVATMSEKEQK